MRKLSTNKTAGLVDSKAIQFITKNVNKTDVKGGPIRVMTNRQKLTVVFDEGGTTHRFQGSFSPKTGKWKVLDKYGSFSSLIPTKTAKDEVVLNAMESVFELA